MLTVAYRRRYTIIIGLFGLLGFLFGFLHNRLAAEGYLTAWQKLPVPEAAGLTLIGTTWRGAFVQTAEGELFLCKEWKAHCEPPESPLIQSEESDKPCSPDFIAFASFVRPPRQIRQCMQGQLLADSTTDSIAVLDESGRLWLWQHTQESFLPWLAPLMRHLLDTIAGFAVGSFVVVIAYLIQRRRMAAKAE